MKIYYIDRLTPIKHFSDLSILKQYKEISQLDLQIPAKENFVIQLAVLPENEKIIKAVQISGSENIFCLNTNISDKYGNKYTKEISLRPNNIHPIFIIVPSVPPKSGTSEEYKLTFVSDCGSRIIHLNIKYTDEDIKNGGFNDLNKLSRLIWLNSNRFINNEVIEPYMVPHIQDNNIKITGRDIRFGSNGLPDQVYYYFDEGINLTEEFQKKLFLAPLSFDISDERIRYNGVTFSQDKGLVEIFSNGQSYNFEISVYGKLHYEGSIYYSVKVKALKDITVNNISLTAMLDGDCAKYMNGMSAVGSAAHSIKDKWTDKKHRDCLYVGTVNAGMRIKWKAENYRKPLINTYYNNLPLILPEKTWDNHGKGNIIFNKTDNYGKIIAETGAFSMERDETRSFDFEIHFVPFKPIDYKKHYSVRYFHNDNLCDEYKDLREAAEQKLTHMVIHHGNELHPFINYPFIETSRLKKLVDNAKLYNIGIKVYYTLREHSNHMAEVFAYKALDDEIILRKNGIGHSIAGGRDKWLKEYFGDDIIPAWKVVYTKGKYKGNNDISFIVRPDSRLDNYYIEGLSWLVENIGIQGIYIDDTSMDRTTIERAKKVLGKDRLIDMHMWNHETECAGDTSCMNLYTELFPFLDSLWIGEGFDVKKFSPDYLLTEVSGIPYGQTSQMLQNGGDYYIGMLYAMNNRYGWGYKNAKYIYSIWDNFGIADSEMRGYWHSKNPVKTGDNNIKATIYIKKTSALLCMYNFNNKDKKVKIDIDNDLLGFIPSSAKIIKPGSVKKDSIDVSSEFLLSGKKGIFILLNK